MSPELVLFPLPQSGGARQSIRDEDGGMIEDLASYIPESLNAVSGKVFYSGRDAFRVGAPVYVLGYNPGGDPEGHADETVGTHTKAVLKEYASNWSAYRDENWRGPAGTTKIQPVILALLERLGLDPGLTPASNLIFERSTEAADLRERKNLQDLCWPFHAKAIDWIKPRFVICFGSETGKYVRQKLAAHREISRFEEQNNRRWTSYAHRAADGRTIFTLMHPSRAKWTTPATDPRPMVEQIFKEIY